MTPDSRLSSVLHILLHLMEAPAPVPSEQLAAALKSNPVVVRRTLAGLREAGLVLSEKGHGGGWQLAQSPDDITLLDVYHALGSPTLFAIGHRSDHPVCLLECAVNATLDAALKEAQQTITVKLQRVTLTALMADFHGHSQPFPCPAPVQTV